MKHLAEHAATWGVRAGKVSFDFAKVMARKNAQIKDFADYRARQLNGGKFKFIRANAKFLDAHTLQLGRADLPASPDARQRVPTKITAKHFIIATGSRVAPPPLPQLNEAGFLTSDEAMALKKLPQVAHRARRRGGGVRVRAVLRPVRRDGDFDPAQRARPEGI